MKLSKVPKNCVVGGASDRGTQLAASAGLILTGTSRPPTMFRPSSPRAYSAIRKPKHQFVHRPARPSPASPALEFLPPAKFTLSIVSLSYNRPNVHGLLSPSFPASRSIRHTDTTGLFLLTAIPSRFVNLAQPIPSHIQTLSSCFSKEDQERWLKRRAAKREARAKSARPVCQLRLTFSLRIKELHKSSVVRKTLRKRWIAALKLIVQYGAYLPEHPSSSSPSLTPSGGQEEPRASRSDQQEEHQEEGLVRLDPSQAGFDKWLDPNHHYIVHPTLAINTASLPLLISAIRTALSAIQRAISNNSPPPPLRTPHHLRRPTPPQTEPPSRPTTPSQTEPPHLQQDRRPTIRQRDHISYTKDHPPRLFNLFKPAVQQPFSPPRRLPIPPHKKCP
ncbi:hypothetical protein PTTG_04169 [Puccinia triticina 1-1 BBBD Race 1]|uniref:Uncharacterized protein n=1 Tax=Puccinia triticina (isolate 1-1 / race 1 (BBBD)) TaxID=630390 RepID=A0A0C4ETP0_PUCT1|nr:hypothetical protein PTTG_04169 [Puccinia triticina 1-1 BBBD Race 1]